MHLYQETSQNKINAILVNGNILSYTTCAHFANVSRFPTPTVSMSSCTDDKLCTDNADQFRLADCCQCLKKV